MRSGALLMFAAFVAALARAQDLSVKFDYTTKAVSLSQALGAISKASHVSLFANDELADEPIIFRLRQVTLSDAMAKIASTVGAEWSKTPSGYELGRSDEIAENLRQSALTEEIKQFKEMIGRQLKACGVDKPATQQSVAQHVRNLFPSNDSMPSVIETDSALTLLPDHAAELRVLSKIDPAKIIESTNDRILVFSNKPTKMERPIEGDLSQIGDDLFQQHNWMVDSISKEVASGAKLPWQIDHMPLTPLTEKPDRFVLTLSRYLVGQGFGLQMLVFDSNNKPILSAYGGDSFDSELLRAIGNINAIARQTSNEKDIVFSPVASYLMAKNRTPHAQKPDQRIVDEGLHELVNPESIDPLSLFVSEALIGTADQRNENLVAYPDDTLFRLIPMLYHDHLKPSQVIACLQQMQSWQDTEVSENDGWLTIAASDRLGTLRNRTDRAAMGEFYRGFLHDGRSTIESDAALAQSIKGLLVPPLLLSEPYYVSPDIGDIGDFDVPVLKLYASLSDNQLRQLKDGSSLPVSTMSSDQIDLIAYVFYQGPFFGESTTLPGLDADVYFAPTESVPNGLAADATIQMADHSDPLYYVKFKTGNYEYTQVAGVKDLATYLYASAHPQPSQDIRILSISPGVQRKISVTINATSDRSRTAELTESMRVQGGPWTTDNLPLELKAAIFKASNGVIGSPQSEPAPQPATAVPPK